MDAGAGARGRPRSRAGTAGMADQGRSGRRDARFLSLRVALCPSPAVARSVRAADRDRAASGAGAAARSGREAALVGPCAHRAWRLCARAAGHEGCSAPARPPGFRDRAEARVRDGRQASIDHGTPVTLLDRSASGCSYPRGRTPCPSCHKCVCASTTRSASMRCAGGAAASSDFVWRNRSKGPCPDGQTATCSAGTARRPPQRRPRTAERLSTGGGPNSSAVDGRPAVARHGRMEQHV